MMVRGLNGETGFTSPTAEFIASRRLHRAYITIPTGPRAEEAIRPPEPASVAAAVHRFRQTGLAAEGLIRKDDVEIGFTGNARADLLRTTAVQPVREESVQLLLRLNHVPAILLEDLLKSGEIERVERGGERFYIRRLQRRSIPGATHSNDHF